LGKENPNIIRWCRDIFVDLDKQRFEIEQQERLKCTMTALDVCGQIFLSIIIIRKMFIIFLKGKLYIGIKNHLARQ
jgi:hypothetical protein